MKQLLTMTVLFIFIKTINAQNVGIGTLTPSFPLHVVTSGNVLSGFDGGNYSYIRFSEGGTYRGYLGSFSGNVEDMDFGTGAGNTTGKVHLTRQGNPKLTIGDVGYVGINNSNPQWDLDVNGSMQLKGRLYVTGSSGTTGQVLTSNGLSAPSWRTLNNSYENTTRFAASFLNSNSTAVRSNDYVLFSSNRYNLDPDNINILEDGIILTKSGLYHFDIQVSSNYYFSAVPESTPSFRFALYTVNRPNPFELVYFDYMKGSKNGSSSLNFSFSGKYSIELHVEAGQKIRLYHGFSTILGSSYGVDGYIVGHLISP